MALRNQPYLPLYVQDFLTDEKLNECSACSQGIYIKLMCLMHKSETYGKILLEQKYKQNDKPIVNFANKLVKHLPFAFEEILNALNELTFEKVLQYNENELWQKRMVRDNELSSIRAEAGSKGGKKTQFAKANIQPKPQPNDQPNDLPKTQPNTEYENEYENEIKTDDLGKGGLGEKPKLKPEINIPFNEFWETYAKKVGDKAKCEKKWLKLTDEDR